MVFAVGELRGPSPDPRGPLGGHREHVADPRRILSDEAVKWKVLSTRQPEEPFLMRRAPRERAEVSEGFFDNGLAGYRRVESVLTYATTSRICSSLKW